MGLWKGKRCTRWEGRCWRWNCTISMFEQTGPGGCGCMTNWAQLIKVQCMDIFWVRTDALVTSLWILVIPEFVHKPCLSPRQRAHSWPSQGSQFLPWVPSVWKQHCPNPSPWSCILAGIICQAVSTRLAWPLPSRTDRLSLSLTSPPSQVVLEGSKKGQWKGHGRALECCCEVQTLLD